MIPIIMLRQSYLYNRNSYLCSNHIFYWTSWNKFQWNLNQDTKISLKTNAFENVNCKMTFDGKLLLEPVVIYYIIWTVRNKCQWNFNENTKNFFKKNAFENIIWTMCSVQTSVKKVVGPPALTHLGLVSHICVMKNSPHFPSDAYMCRKSLYFSYRYRGRPTK